MKSAYCLRNLLFLLLPGMFLTGCVFKRVTDSPRQFVLTPIPAEDAAPAAKGRLSIGLGFVRMPSQLLRSTIAVHNGTNEIEYLENALWAERLDHCFQRTLAVNLSRLLSSDGIYVDDWRGDGVMVRVSVQVQQFELDTHGTGTLIAQWRITAPEKGLALKSGLARLARTGASPRGKPEAIVTTLSDLAADFSRDLAQSVRESLPAAAPSSASTAMN
jgi:uncharacterized lipoprotein YmbA